MTTRKQRARLILPNEIERSFDEAAIQCLAEAAKLPQGTDLERFGRSIRAAVHQYLIDAAIPQPGEIRMEIEQLASTVQHALNGEPGRLEAAVAALEALPPATRKTFEEHSHPRSVPSARDLRDSVYGRTALSLLFGLCHRGAEWEMGRKRPSGKRSRPHLQPRLAGPRVQRGRPSNRAEFMLCNRLAGTYWRATGRSPPHRVDMRKPGPFLRLVQEVLVRIGASHINAAELIDPRRKRRRSRKHAIVNE